MDVPAHAALLAQAAPTEDLSIFHPVSPAGDSIVSLSLLVLAITAGIFLIVSAVLAYCVLRFRTKRFDGREPPQVYGSVPIEVAWTAAPGLIVFILVLVTTRTLWDTKIPVPEPADGDHALFVTVVGRQWWWEYQYEYYNGRKLGFTTANELHLPMSDDQQRRPVYLRLKSADVCHSFWTPRLAGKVDLIPGRVNTMWIETKAPGLYLGQCAEYCGTQHANMLLNVYVEPTEAFDAWLEQEAASARTDNAAARGRATFFKHSCVNCHAVRGTTARGGYGPDLTHLMNRKTLASGQIPNTPENLRAWIRNPQVIKPGNLMPAFGLSEQELEDVAAYLETLN